ncbi:MAG: cyanophycin synthetase [Flammeovirgaceae bacterium]
MRILRINALNGPNFWSIKWKKLIVMELDLEELEDKPTNLIPGFLDRLKKMMPSLEEHQCSEGKRGGFFKRVEEGTWMGHVIEHIAIELQNLAGMDCAFGRTRSTGQKGVYNVVFSYEEEECGRYAAKAAVEITEKLANGEEYNGVDLDVQDLREIRQSHRLGPSTQALVDEATARGIPFIRLNDASLVQLGYGINQQRLQATMTSKTSSIAVDIASNKDDTKRLLSASSIPTPKGAVVRSEFELEDEIDYIGYPVVIKPLDANHGKGVTTNITNWDEALKAFDLAQEYSKSVIVEQYIKGFDHRLLVINFQFTAAAKRTPACVVGDGVATVQELVDKVNLDPRRGIGHEKVLTQINLDQPSIEYLAEQGMTPQSVPAAGEVVYLKRTANLSTGGTSTDVTDIVHPSISFMAERIARIIGLDICGIDLMTSDISKPLDETGGAVLEVNAAPGFRMHTAPTEGLPRNVAEPVIDMLFPAGVNPRIPIFAVTGTNGKTTTTRLLAHIARSLGHKVGFTTTDGIYIQHRLIDKGDTTGPESARTVLKDPTVDFAVLECARGGLLRGGLGFDWCDIGVVMNVASDHLGMRGINTLEDLAKVKAVIAESVAPHGYAILNADDDLVYKMAERVKSKVAFFSLKNDNPRVLEHCDNGGLAAIVEEGYVVICKGQWKLRVAKVVNIPLSFEGKAVFNIQNILAATLASFCYGFKIADIKQALHTFIPSPAQTPGRMNMFRVNDRTVMVDYAHNPAALKALSTFLEKVNASIKIGIIAGIGDRRDEDTLEVGRVSSKIFDEIIIREDEDLRGKRHGESIDLVKKGILEVNPNKKITIIEDELEAIRYAVTNSPKDAFITVSSERIQASMKLVLRLREELSGFSGISHSDIPNIGE